MGLDCVPACDRDYLTPACDGVAPPSKNPAHDPENRFSETDHARNNKLQRDDASKKSHHALIPASRPASQRDGERALAMINRVVARL
jgi:hypothetical protein